MKIDSKHWDWGKGYCRKHPGNSVPCNVCIASNDPDLTTQINTIPTAESQTPFVVRPSGTVSALTIEGSSMELFGLERQPELLCQMDFEKPITVHNGEICKIAYTMQFHEDGTKTMTNAHIEIIPDNRPLIEKMKEAHNQLLDKLAKAGITMPEQINSFRFNSALPNFQPFYAPTEFKPRIPIDTEVLRATCSSSFHIEPVQESIKNLIDIYGELVKEQFLAEGGTEKEWAYLLGEENDRVSDDSRAE